MDEPKQSSQNLPAEPAIELYHATKRYGSVRALDDVSISFAPGEIVCILGMNGAGKSTLLRVIAGLVSLNAGDVKFQGQSIRRENLEHRQSIVFLPDFPPLLWEESVINNLTAILRLYGATAPGIENRVTQLLHGFDLLGQIDSPAGTLSRGQAYKTSLTALLAINPPVWLLDEPLASGMDPIGLNAFKLEARRAAQSGRTIIFTTQILEIAERYADRIAVLNYGKLRAFETVSSLKSQNSQGEQSVMELLQKLHDEGSTD